MITDARILVTGATGQVATRTAHRFNEHNEVFAAARFRDTEARAALDAAGITTVPFTLGEADLGHLPDVDYVVHCAAATMPESVDEAFGTNADGAGFLMQRYADATAFFHMSSASVYRDDGSDEALTEEAALGGRSEFSPHYASSKLAGEAVARFQSRALGLPTVIARLETAYGTHGHGGLPNVLAMMLEHGMAYQRRRDGDSPSVPIHEDDIARQVEALLGAAAVPALVVNLGGDEETTIEAVIAHLEALTGREMVIEDADRPSWETKRLDATRRRALGGPCQIAWRDGVRAVLEANHPDLVV